MSQEILTQLDLLEEIAATAGYKSCRVLAEGTEDTFCLFVTVPTDQTAFDVAANMVDACWTVQDGVSTTIVSEASHRIEKLSDETVIIFNGKRKGEECAEIGTFIDKELHWYCFTYVGSDPKNGGTATASTVTGYVCKDLKLSAMYENKINAGLTEDAVLTGLSYFGKMPKSLFVSGRPAPTLEKINKCVAVLTEAHDLFRDYEAHHLVSKGADDPKTVRNREMKEKIRAVIDEVSIV
jgi:hypothetical protein